MNLLALSTSTQRWAVWLHRHDGWHRGVQAEAGRGTGQRASLTRMVWQLLDEAALQPADLQRVVCDIGPGSFTGLRQGLALARALAWAHGIPGHGVGSLDAMAWSLRDAIAPGQSLAVALPARADVDFVGLRQPGVWSEQALAAADARAWWQQARPDVLGVPTGDRNRALTRLAEAEGARIVDAYPQAETMGRWYIAHPEVVPLALAPRYLALSEAENHAGVAVPETTVPTINRGAGTHT